MITDFLVSVGVFFIDVGLDVNVVGNMLTVYIIIVQAKTINQYNVIIKLQIANMLQDYTLNVRLLEVSALPSLNAN